MQVKFPMALFGAVCLAALAVIAGLITWASIRHPVDATRGVAEVVGAPDLVTSSGVPLPRKLYFRHNGLGPNFGTLAWTDLTDIDGGINYIDGLACESAYVAGGRGICLAADRGVVTTYTAKVFDAHDYTVSATIPLAGVPSRTRVSPDGAIGAITVFVTGHGYDSVDFSTRTLLVDLRRGEVMIEDLETFDVFENGNKIQNADFNFWGVTFTPDSARFYATLSTNGRNLLVTGSVATASVEVLREGIECPSLSPDGRRVAFKHRIVEGGRVSWELRVLDLASGQVTPLSERRSVDDQLEWLGNEFVLYSVLSAASGSAATDVWVARADGAGEPAPLIRNAYSPAVIRQ